MNTGRLHHWHLKFLLLFSIIILFLVHESANAEEFTVSIRSPESLDDKRDTYTTALIKLVLNKTIPTHGNYRLIDIPSMTRPRSIYAAEMQMYPNLLLQDNYQERFSLEGHLQYIEFPTELGLTGTRICFVNEKVKNKVAQAKTLKELKTFSIAQGVGWADSLILQSSGFKVTEIPNYDGIFKMVASGRVDLFCRGINELLVEYKAFSHLEGLTYDESFAIQYPLPRFFLTNKKNTKLIERVGLGLQIAYSDGSLLALWHNYNDESIAFANLKSRKIFRIPNPLLGKINPKYQQYIYNLEQ